MKILYQLEGGVLSYAMCGEVWKYVLYMMFCDAFDVDCVRFLVKIMMVYAEVCPPEGYEYIVKYFLFGYVG